MSWIEIYIGLNFFVIAILILLLFINKTRLPASALSASLILLYDAKLFSINAGHFNSKGYSELAKLIQADFLK